MLLEASLKPSEPPANPGEASYFGWRTRRGLVFSGSFDPERMAVLSPPTAMEQWLSETRTALAAHARRLAPSKEASDLYLTLAAGLRAELGEELEEEFARSGLAHVLSVSGLHVAALALFTLVGLRWLLVRLWRKARSIDARRVAAPLSIPLLWGYVIFTGSQPPAVRSAVMATVVLLGLALWRRGDPLNALAVAAMVVLVADPSCVSDLSMQLSFLAVASLLLLAPAIRQAIPLERPPPSLRPRWRLALARLREAVVGTFCASLAVTLASAPLLAAAFHRVSLAGLFSNILCLPLCGALTALAAAGAALFTVSPEASGPLLWAGTWASELLLGAAHLFASLPGASVHLPSFGPYASAAFVAGLGAWAVARGRARLFSLLAPAALVAAFALPALRPRAGLEVTFLSVGHGDAIVLSSGGESALVDGGGSPEGADTGRRFVLPYLRERRIDRLELAVLSHPHPDHALGLASTLSKVPARRLWLPAGSAEGELSSLVRAAAGSSEVEEVELGRAPFRLGEAVLEVLGPPRDRVLLEGVNDRSVVIQVRHGAVSFLLTGDVEEAGEEALPLSPVTVLKAPHHGSRTSSSPALVETTRPRYVVFCVGRGRFGLPHQEVVDRYQEAGAECLRTDLHGAIRFESDGRSVSVETFRRPERAAVARHRPAVHR
ncbi:MAG: DNA internalization-related competence protein ComEC/Rec2 [Myxococcales bacterium]|nr:DNA internalization-related competence protein ComEC/Rec2 [Myxococcales bacterium]